MSCFTIAQEAILLHKLLDNTLLEDQDSWMLDRLKGITEILQSIKHFVQYEVESTSTQGEYEVAMEDGSVGTTTACDIAIGGFGQLKKKKMKEEATGVTPTTANIKAGGKVAAPQNNNTQPNTNSQGGAVGTPVQTSPNNQTAQNKPNALPTQTGNPAQDAQNKAKIANNLRKAGNAQLANKLSANNTNNLNQNEIDAITAASSTK